MDARGGLRVHEGYEPRACALDGSRDGVAAERRTPLRIHPGDACSDTRRHLAHAFAEDTRHAHDGVVTGLEQIGEACLHPRAARGREGERERVVGTEDPAQPLLDLVDHGQELRVEVAHEGLGHGGKHPRVDVRRAGTEEQAAGQGVARHRVILGGRREASLLGCRQCGNPQS
jgi:hypothetical protein